MKFSHSNSCVVLRLIRDTTKRETEADKANGRRIIRAKACNRSTTARSIRSPFSGIKSNQGRRVKEETEGALILPWFFWWRKRERERETLSLSLSRFARFRNGAEFPRDQAQHANSAR